jgi:hypothetical protein
LNMVFCLGTLEMIRGIKTVIGLSLNVAIASSGL